MTTIPGGRKAEEIASSGLVERCTTLAIMGMIGDTRAVVKELPEILATANESLAGASKEVRAAAAIGAVAFGAVALVACVALLVAVSRPVCGGHA